MVHYNNIENIIILTITSVVNLVAVVLYLVCILVIHCVVDYLQ